MQSLFPVGGGQSAQNSPLYQFRAGKCQLTPQSNGKFLVSADLRRGNVQLVRGPDSLLHFRWANFTNGAVEDDRIIMPGDAVFKRVKTGRPDDRVYTLKFHYNSNNQNRLLFWLQNKDTSKDEEIINKVNDLLNNPNAVLEAANANGGVSGAGAAGGLGGLLGGLGGGANQPDWLQHMMGGMNPRAAAAGHGLGVPPAVLNATAPAPAPAAARAQPNPNAGAFGGLDFAALLNQLNNPGSAARPAQAAVQPASSSSQPSGAPAARVTMEDFRRATAQSASQPRTPNLQDILLGEEIIRSGILNDPQVREELIAQLPPEQQTAEHLEATIRSPQLQQAITSLNDAVLPPDNFHSIATNFNLNPANGTDHLLRGDGVGAFLATVQAAHPAEPQQPPPTANQEEKKDEDTKMEE